VSEGVLAFSLIRFDKELYLVLWSCNYFTASI